MGAVFSQWSSSDRNQRTRGLRADFDPPHIGIITKIGVDTLEEKLAAITAKECSGWLDDAKYRIENERWLKHSQFIALRILRTLRATNISQKELAEKIGVSPQHVNKIVKGRENLTLETISKLEAALEIELLMAPSLAIDTETEIGQPYMPNHKTMLATAKKQHSTPT